MEKSFFLQGLKRTLKKGTSSGRFSHTYSEVLSLNYTIRFFFFIFIFLLLFSGLVYSKGNKEAEEIIAPVYGLGDQMFEINAGLFIPLFFQATDGSTSSTNLSLGGGGSLGWSAFLAQQFSLGAELGGMFNISPLKRVLIHIPITAKIGYMFRVYPVDIIPRFSTGIVFTKLQEELYVGPILKPGVTAVYNINTEWAVGLNVMYWWLPQFYTDEDLKDDTRFGNFLEVSLSGVYHF